MGRTSLVIGGCKSGKSSHALTLAAAAAPRKRYFFATCVPHDDEMRQRVARHKAERDTTWQAIEVPLRLPEEIERYSVSADVILVDCLTLWLNNLVMENDDATSIAQRVNDLVTAIDAAACRIIIVSNEVGAGIVPENRLARLFRDVAGLANQQVAAAVDDVILVVAGIPVAIKGGTIAP